MSAQIAGFTVANLAEVESATKALRTTLRPEDYGSLGIFRLAGVSGTAAAGALSAAQCFSFCWQNASNICLVKRVMVSMGNTATAFTAGLVVASMIVLRSFTAAQTGGTSVLPSGNQNKMRTSMGNTLLTDARIGTAALTGTTFTADANPVGSVVSSVPAVAGTPPIPPTLIFDQRPGEHPLVLAQNEGFGIQLTVPATGTWQWAVVVDWVEIASY